jgi:hypothetical protein
MDREDYEFMDAFYVRKDMCKNYCAHVVAYRAYLEGESYA